jgi:hypothetical protein
MKRQARGPSAETGKDAYPASEKAETLKTEKLKSEC